MSVQQGPCLQDRDSLRLIPPLAEEFILYGGPGTVKRARMWALDRHYLLADGVPRCAHGLYLLGSCPADACRNSFKQLDHANLWVPAADTSERPFLLSHPYCDVIHAETITYADAHGLQILADSRGDDGWYGAGTMPIRMSVPESWPLWPIEAKAIVLLDTYPVKWPDGS